MHNHYEYNKHLFIKSSQPVQKLEMSMLGYNSVQDPVQLPELVSTRANLPPNDVPGTLFYIATCRIAYDFMPVQVVRVI